MKYIVYRNPANSYESFVERYCLRKRLKAPHCQKKKEYRERSRMHVAGEKNEFKQRSGGRFP